MDRILKKLIAGRTVIISSTNLIDTIHKLSEDYIVDEIKIRNLGLRFSMIIPGNKLIKKENDINTI
jgi:hypothetical protein